jgi:hypothetical protein
LDFLPIADRQAYFIKIIIPSPPAFDAMHFVATREPTPSRRRFLVCSGRKHELIFESKGDIAHYFQ